MTKNKRNHSANCILRQPCANADTSACTPLCPSYIAIHGYDGEGGRVSAAGVPSDYRRITLTTSPARENQPDAYRMLDAYAKTFGRMFDSEADRKPQGRIKSLYLWSESPGTGKTTSASALINEWIISHYIGSIQRGVSPLDRPAYFLDVNSLQTLYNGFNRNGIPRDVAEPIAREYYSQETIAKTTPFVVMDDIGIRNATEAFRSDLHGIINHRVTNAFPTVYTSNVPISDLERLYDARLVDRIRDMCLEIQFEGLSKRGMRK